MSLECHEKFSDNHLFILVRSTKKIAVILTIIEFEESFYG